MIRTFAGVLALLALAACSGPGPARPMPKAFDADTGSLPGGLAAHGIGTRDGGTLLDAAAGPLMGYWAALAPAADAPADLYRRAVEEDDLAAAGRILDEVIATAPDDPAAWNDRALVHLAAGEREDAERCLREASVRSLDYVPSRRNLDRLYSEAR